MTWDMAGLRARTYKVPKKTPKSVGPTIVDMVDHAGALVNGVATPYTDVLKLKSNSALDDQEVGCYDCGFTICGCDSRCEDCGSLLHSVCEQYCDGCNMRFKSDEHDFDACYDAEHRGSAPPPPPLRGWVLGTNPALEQTVVQSYVDGKPADFGQPLTTVCDILDAWATYTLGTRFAQMHDRAYERCKSWLISMKYRTADRDGMFSLLKVFDIIDDERRAAERLKNGGTPADFAQLLRWAETTKPGDQYNFPINTNSTFPVSFVNELR